MDKTETKAKTIRHFVNRLLLSAAKHRNWNVTMMSNLFLLLSVEIEFDSKTTKGYLKSMKKYGSPELIAELLHRNIIKLPERDILDVLVEQANNLNDFFHLIRDSIAQDLLDLNSRNTILEVSKAIVLHSPNKISL